MTDAQKALEDLIKLSNCKDQYGWDWGTDGSIAISFIEAHIETIRSALQAADKVEGLVKALEHYAEEADNMFDFARTPALKGTSNAHRALAAFRKDQP